jgi:hypothetical protein
MPDDIKPQDVQPQNSAAEEPSKASKDVQPVPADQAPPAEANEDVPREKEQAKDLLDVPKPPRQHEEHHLIPIVLALVLLILLAAIAIIGGDKINRQNTTGNGSTAQPAQTSQQTEAPTQDKQTLDGAIQTIKSLSTDEDTSGQGLSDQNLGL